MKKRLVLLLLFLLLSLCPYGIFYATEWALDLKGRTYDMTWYRIIRFYLSPMVFSLLAVLVIRYATTWRWEVRPTFLLVSSLAFAVGTTVFEQMIMKERLSEFAVTQLPYFMVVPYIFLFLAAITIIDLIKKQR